MASLILDEETKAEERTPMEIQDRHSVSRGNTIRRTARTQPLTLIRDPPSDEDLRRATLRAIRSHGMYRQRLLEQTRQMGRENRDFRTSTGSRMSASNESSEVPREVSRQINDFAEPNYISDLTTTSMGFPSERISRRYRNDEEGNKVVKRSKSPGKRGGRRSRRKRKSHKRKSRRGRKSQRKSRQTIRRR